MKDEQVVQKGERVAEKTPRYRHVHCQPWNETGTEVQDERLVENEKSRKQVEPAKEPNRDISPRRDERRKKKLNNRETGTASQGTKQGQMSKTRGASKKYETIKIRRKGPGTWR